MKHIQKNNPPQSLLDFKKKTPSAHWDHFDTDVKRELAKSLRAEQGHICCYCEQSLQQESNKTHIEHLKPKSRFPQETFRYENLLLSCQEEKSCGRKKANWYSHNMVTPLDNDCEDRFIFTGNGEILPAQENDQHAQETIDQLGLNFKKLKDMRKEIYITYLKWKREDPEKSKEFLDEMLQQNENGDFVAFWTTIKYVAEKA